MSAASTNKYGWSDAITVRLIGVDLLISSAWLSIWETFDRNDYYQVFMTGGDLIPELVV